jgi:hypothetical protein
MYGSMYARKFNLFLFPLCGVISRSEAAVHTYLLYAKSSAVRSSIAYLSTIMLESTVTVTWRFEYSISVACGEFPSATDFGF